MNSHQLQLNLGSFSNTLVIICEGVLLARKADRQRQTRTFFVVTRVRVPYFKLERKTMKITDEQDRLFSRNKIE